MAPFSALILAFFLAGSALATPSWEAIPGTDFRVPPPATDGSPDQRADLERLHRFERERTETDCALANHQAYPGFDVLYVGDGMLTPEEAKRFSSLITRAMDLTERVTSYHKRKYARPRPYQADPTLHPCVKMPTGATAYPSSHASMSVAGACLLAYAFPTRSRALARAGKRAGDLRAVAGVHYVADVKSGQALGQAVCERLLHEKSFLAELRSVRR